MTHPLLLALVSGALFSVALPNEIFLFGSPLLGLICLAPLFIALMRCRTPGKAAAAGAVFAFVSTPLSNYWLAFFKDYAFLTIGSVTAAYTVLFAVFAVFLWKFSRPGPYRPFLVAAFWTVYEFIKSTGYLAYPWGLVSYPVNTVLPLLQIADIAGIWPISFLMAFANALAAEAADLAGRRHPSPDESRNLAASAVFLLILAAGFLGYGFVRMSRPIPAAARLNAVLVQQNVDPWLSGGQEEALLRIQELSRRGAEKAGGRPDIVVWSESSLFRPYTEYASRFTRYPPGDPFIPFLRGLGVPLLTGNPIVRGGSPRRVQNGVILLAPDGSVLDDYGKRHPVPMAEHVPFWEWKPVRDFFRNVVGLDSIWDLGDRDTIFSLTAGDGKTVRFGAPICFEDAFPYLCRRFVRGGADLLINLTNDAWSRMASAQTQHFVAARFRSIEMKRTLIRSTNAGLTAVVGPFGEISAELPMFREGFLAEEIAVAREEGLTPYTLFGDYLPVALAALLTLFLLRDKKKAAPAWSGHDFPTGI